MSQMRSGHWEAGGHYWGQSPWVNENTAQQRSPSPEVELPILGAVKPLFTLTVEEVCSLLKAIQGKTFLNINDQPQVKNHEVELGGKTWWVNWVCKFGG